MAPTLQQAAPVSPKNAGASPGTQAIALHLRAAIPVLARAAIIFQPGQLLPHLLPAVAREYWHIRRRKATAYQSTDAIAARHLRAWRRCRTGSQCDLIGPLSICRGQCWLPRPQLMLPGRRRCARCCQLTDCKSYTCGNLETGTVQDYYPSGGDHTVRAAMRHVGRPGRRACGFADAGGVAGRCSHAAARQGSGVLLTDSIYAGDPQSWAQSWAWAWA